MKNRFKSGVVFVALMAWFIGALPVFGQVPSVQTLEDGATIFPVFGSNLAGGVSPKAPIKIGGE